MCQCLLVDKLSCIELTIMDILQKNSSELVLIMQSSKTKFSRTYNCKGFPFKTYVRETRINYEFLVCSHIYSFIIRITSSFRLFSKFGESCNIFTSHACCALLGMQTSVDPTH